jgi:hypothetical protein
MKFMVSRTSRTTDVKPCSEAKQEKYTRVDERSTDDPAKIPAMRGKPADWWFADGTNHRIENGHIKRDFEDTAWFIKINTLAQLIEFIEKYDQVIVSKSFWNPSIMSIEIYDDYRE